MTETLERAARALCRRVHEDRPDAHLFREGEIDAKVDAYWQKWVPAVLAVLRAIREPDHAMWEAGVDAGATGDCTIVFPAMIDALIAQGGV